MGDIVVFNQPGSAVNNHLGAATRSGDAGRSRFSTAYQIIFAVYNVWTLGQGGRHDTVLSGSIQPCTAGSGKAFGGIGGRCGLINAIAAAESVDIGVRNGHILIVFGLYTACPGLYVIAQVQCTRTVC